MYELELKRRENDKKILAVYGEMRDMMAALAQYVGSLLLIWGLSDAYTRLEIAYRQERRRGRARRRLDQVPHDTPRPGDRGRHQEVREFVRYVPQEEARREGPHLREVGASPVEVRGPLSQAAHRVRICALHPHGVRGGQGEREAR